MQRTAAPDARARSRTNSSDAAIYAKNHYDTRLAAAFAKWKRWHERAAADPGRFQSRLELSRPGDPRTHRLLPGNVIAHAIRFPIQQITAIYPKYILPKPIPGLDICICFLHAIRRQFIDGKRIEKRGHDQNDDDRASKRGRYSRFSEDTSQDFSSSAISQLKSGNTPVDYAKLHEYPAEIRYEIFGNLTDDKHDIIGTLQNIDSWSLVSRRLRTDAAKNVDKSFVVDAATAVAIAYNGLVESRFEESSFHQTILSLGEAIDSVPLLSRQTRSTIAQEGLKANREPEWVLEKLAANLEYFTKGERSAIVSRIVQGRREERLEGAGNWRKSLETLIGKAEYIAPADRRLLVQESCTPAAFDERPIVDSLILRPWGAVMHTLAVDDQRRVLKAVMADRYGGLALEQLARHVDKLHPDLRDELAEHVISRRDSYPRKSGAICNLAKHLDLFGEKRRAEITKTVLSNLVTSIDERPLLSRSAWYHAPQFQAVEAIHHLHRHQGLAGPDWGKVRNKVDAFLKSEDDIGIKTQLMAWMPEEQCTEHARQVLIDSRDRAPTPEFLALTTRVDTLPPDVRAEYITALRTKPCRQESEIPLNRYNIRYNIDKFAASDRSILVERQLNIISLLPSNAGEMFRDLVKVAPELRSADIHSTVGQAHRIAINPARYEVAYDIEGLSTPSYYGEAMRCVGSWCVQQIENAKNMTHRFAERRDREAEKLREQAGPMLNRQVDRSRARVESR